MKRYILIFLLLIVIAVCGTLLLTSCAVQPTNRSDYIRIHIRANSNSDVDQSVKLAVRDVVVQYLTPLANTVKNKQEMWELIESKRENILALADATLYSCGFNYKSELKLGKENFPTRTYGDLTLEAGTYDAVILNLGTGEGNNWWCVAFPPLCFVAGEKTDSAEIKYKSWISELFRK